MWSPVAMPLAAMAMLLEESVIQWLHPTAAKINLAAREVLLLRSASSHDSSVSGEGERLYTPSSTPGWSLFCSETRRSTRLRLAPDPGRSSRG